MRLQAAVSRALTVRTHPLWELITSMYVLTGAFFGTTFAHLFFQSYRELAPAPFYKPTPQSTPHSSEEELPEPSTFTNPNPHGGQKKPEGRVYRPKIYGFRVSELAKSGPRMQWMRMRPQSPHELDMVDWRGRFYEDEDDYEDDEQAEDPDRPMEDFDPVCSFMSQDVKLSR